MEKRAVIARPIPKKTNLDKNDGLERTVWIGIIAASVVGVGLCVVMIPAFSDQPLTPIALGALFAGAAFAAGRQL